MRRWPAKCSAIACAVRQQRSTRKYSGAHAAEQQPSLEGAEDRTIAGADGRDPLPEFIIARGNQRPGHNVAMAVQIFRGRMHDDVGAELDRPRQDRRGDRAVDGKARTGAVGNLGGGGNVGDRPSRIGRALDPNQLGPAGLHRCRERVGRAGVDKIDDHAPIRCVTPQPVPQPPIHDLRRDGVIAGLERQKYRRRCRHSRCKGEAGRPALQPVNSASGTTNVGFVDRP